MIRYGLDFGTTNSSLSLLEKGEVQLEQIDPKAPDPRVLRSMLYFFHRDLVTNPKTKKTSYIGEFKNLIGEEAIQKYLLDNKNRSPGIIRQIFTGKMIQLSISPDAGKADLVAEYYEEVDFGTGRLLQALKTALKSKSYKGSNIFGKFFTLEQLIGFFAASIKNHADNVTGENVTNIKVGRPVKFSDDKNIDTFAQERLEDGLKMAGFKVIDFEFEPVAAAKYFLRKNAKRGQNVFVFDFGGGTLDTAIVKEDEKFEVLATDGIYIGGNLLNADIFENKLADYFGAQLKYGDRQINFPVHVHSALKSWFGVTNLNNPGDMRMFTEAKYKCTDPAALERLVYLIKTNLGFELYEAIEKAKKDLSFKNSSSIRMADGPLNIDLLIEKSEFETIIEPRVKEIEDVVLRTLKSARLEPDQIDFIVRTGGSSLIPCIEKRLTGIFGEGRVKLFDTFTSIAAGLALE